ncbi:MAG: UDP-3-O-(3-hydroxymyristoyl)glucosamine N-acyltransferase [Phycisphaerae bacterium]|nr:MAG: UDP-3-O-(3-hydroxymyristoyl)glucosamine N-acyltransferase [Planctomycetota bacterium]MBE7457006.1 UDP-3-O-(3-hydroxymyristoyl)glucosamine N-acyltransferase [Planctomycetia bacterium]MCK6463635.1 UDP-3-O-(3-hydroxymyristoyl)glucosamine N-acyltransferase [Phycisphaerae bacterium]MCL4718304.1 UDP-3-O-(3-hydroxymyristoyl)glucosamine N-acyltransferase [Phycisphaerae bacterium]MCQ3920390.1 UDP-3-O-(3-hydroxymyristoyl)glucosamine N-acyltransferase [Planctomycetota bacterium]
MAAGGWLRGAPGWDGDVAGSKLSELCRRISAAGFPASLDGADVSIAAVNTLEDAVEGELSFLSNRKYLRLLETTRASAVIAAPDVAVPDGRSVVRCADPYAAVTVAIVLLHGHRRHPRWGVSSRAEIHPSASIGPNANIAPHVTVGEGAVIGADCTLYPGVYVGDRARLGDGVVLFPNVVVYDECVLGHRVTIHAGTVIGEDGLGYAPVGGKWLKIPQVGRVVIEDDVEIGANCAIDRATLGMTRIGAGSKFSNLIAIGHGTKVGENAMFVALVGVAGSVTVGKNVTLAGQVGLAGHLTVGDGASIGAQAGVAGDVPAGAKYLGAPAVEINEAKRQFIAVQRLPGWSKEVNQRLRDLEAELARLRAKINGDQE